MSLLSKRTRKAQDSDNESDYDDEDVDSDEITVRKEY